MPCRDYQPDPGQERVEYIVRPDPKDQQKIDFLEAVLCGLIRSLPVYPFGVVNQKTPFRNFNFKEAGVSKKELETWWAEHQKKDREKEHRELAKAARKTLRKKALGKLTKAERKVLGL